MDIIAEINTLFNTAIDAELNICSLCGASPMTADCNNGGCDD